MSRRPASCFRVSLGAFALVTLAACAGPEREAAVPPPITASKAAEAPDAAPPATPAETAKPEAAPTEAAKAPVKSAPIAPPPHTPGTSLPGAIPPSTLPDPNVKPVSKPADPVQWLRDSQARQADYTRRVGEAETTKATADAAAQTWERNVLAFKNPFLARPQLSPDDTAAIQGMDGAARVTWAEAKLAAAREARDAAQKALDDLKANPPLN